MPSWSRKSSCHSSESSNRSSDRSYTNPAATKTMNRALSIRSHKGGGPGGPGAAAAASSGASSHRLGFSLSSLRGSAQPELSRRLYRLIKTANGLVAAHEAAGRGRVAVAAQLSAWGERTGDEALSDVSDKVGVVAGELGELEDAYARALDDARAVLKQVRDTERSVQPSRDGRRRLADEIARLKAREPESARLVTLEQELVRAEAENLVAEAQLTNISRQKLKEAYDAEFLATIERAEKQIILARHGRRLLQLLDDSPIVPGEERGPYRHGAQARQILNDAEDDLRDWQFDAHDQYPGASHQHEIISEDKFSTQYHSPTMISVGEDPHRRPRQTAASSDDDGETVEITPTAHPQGTLKSARERGEGDEGDSVSGGAVAPGHYRRGRDAENDLQSPQRQLEGSTMIVSGSPVSSVDGWRQHGNMLRVKQPSLAF